MAKEAQLPARFLGPNEVPIGQFEVSMSLIDWPKSFKPLKIRYELRTKALTNLTLFGLTVWAIFLSVEVEVKAR